MPTETQPWLRAELIAAPETTPGPQLMIPADGVEFHDDQLVFHNQGDIVYVAPQGQLRSITWLAKQPNPATARRRAQWPNHGTRWTDEEREDLLRRLQAGQAWKTISTAHGRSRSGCQQEAVKQGWLDAETLRLKPEFLPDAEARRTASAPAPAADEAPATASPNLATDDTGPYAPPSARGLARHATRSEVPKESPRPGSSQTAGAATTSTAEPPASPQPSPAPEFATAAPPPATLARTAAASPSAPHSTDPFSGPPTPDPRPDSAIPQTDPRSGQPTPEAFSGPPTPDPRPGPPPLDALSSRPARSVIPLAEPPAPDASSSPHASESAVPNPDRPRFPPRVPRQRTNPDNLPGPAPESDSGPDSESGPRPGSRFFSRAQSSLARATLGAYMTPPRGEPGAAPGAT